MVICSTRPWSRTSLVLRTGWGQANPRQSSFFSFIIGLLLFRPKQDQRTAGASYINRRQIKKSPWGSGKKWRKWGKGWRGGGAKVQPGDRNSKCSVPAFPGPAGAEGLV